MDQEFLFDHAVQDVFADPVVDGIARVTLESRQQPFVTIAQDDLSIDHRHAVLGYAIQAFSGRHHDRVGGGEESRSRPDAEQEERTSSRGFVGFFQAFHLLQCSRIGWRRRSNPLREKSGQRV